MFCIAFVGAVSYGLAILLGGRKYMVRFSDLTDYDRQRRCEEDARTWAQILDIVMWGIGLCVIVTVVHFLWRIT